mmetsp:Transcript_10730/g.37550  ORF Transcript_10730/g.37550 Transcript_10730/m.37550 type:complete len:292 (+) Transcript_10730:161-1036(+)
MPLSSPAMAANAVKPSGLAPVGAVRPAAAPVSQPTSRPPSRAGNDTVHCIEVSVGGTIFRASASTLKKSPFLASLLSDEFIDDMRDPEGRLFVDRDPELFAEVLRLMRGCEPRAGTNSWYSVKAEADFYQIPLNLLRAPVEVIVPPDILVVRHLYSYTGTPSSEALRGDELCMYCLTDLPPDLKTQIRIDSVLVNRHQCGSKTVFVISQQVLEEAGFYERSDGLWERTERRLYHRSSGVELVIPKHPMEVDRERQEHFLCITYVVPLVGPVIATSTGGVVGVQNHRRSFGM